MSGTTPGKGRVQLPGFVEVMPSPGGPALGTRETCAWIAAAAVSEGRETTIVDYIETWASPVGNAFAYCDQVG